MTDELVEVHSSRELLSKGYRPIILSFVADGLTKPEMVQALKEEFGIKVHGIALNKALKRLKVEDLQTAQAQANRQEYAELHKIAVEEMNRHKEAYHQAIQNDAPLKFIQFLEEAFESWWEKVGKFHFTPAGGNVTVNLQAVVNSQTIILEEFKDDPERYERVKARLKGTGGISP